MQQQQQQQQKGKGGKGGGRPIVGQGQQQNAKFNPSSLRPCVFCRVDAFVIGRPVNNALIRHRFSQCPMLPRNIQANFMKYDSDLAAGAITEDEATAYGFDEDFCEQTDGWGHDQNGLDNLANPTNNHSLAQAAQRVDEQADQAQPIHIHLNRQVHE